MVGYLGGKIPKNSVGGLNWSFSTRIFLTVPPRWITVTSAPPIPNSAVTVTFWKSSFHGLICVEIRRLETDLHPSAIFCPFLQKSPGLPAWYVRDNRRIHGRVLPYRLRRKGLVSKYLFVACFERGAKRCVHFGGRATKPNAKHDSMKAFTEFNPIDDPFKRGEK